MAIRPFKILKYLSHIDYNYLLKSSFPKKKTYIAKTNIAFLKKLFVSGNDFREKFNLFSSSVQF